ncbi:DNA-directed RNA polymerase subunit A' [Candidatus Micrarchaeota archaeon]|nr:DNA-directed RNA polymerase subunit A' [Candidatus Micrarchaeota archaeon]
MVDKKVKSVEFELLSPDLVRKMSTVRVVTPDTYDDDGFPIEGGLMDLRLGVIDPGLRCKTCGGRITSCSGHFGHIDLVRPVIHIGYVKMVLTLLKTPCRKCGRVLMQQDKLEKFRELMLREEKEEDEEETISQIEKTKKATKCPGCGERQGNIKLLKPTTFFDGNQRLLPSQIRERLERVKDEDLRMLGVNPKVARPEWAILTALPVPPATTRPSITLETGERSEDDLTHKLVDVLRINQRLADNISAGAPQLIIEDLWDLLQYHVTTYFNNEVSGIPPARHRSGRPLKTLFQRLKGKEGRFRYYLSGKRVNFSARTVISPDPNISISEVGVPLDIARELTVPVAVTELNLKDAQEMVKSTSHPSVNYVIRPDGKRKKISPLNREEVLAEVTPGYVIERQLSDGDVVLFNRQPSLHRLSMMAHHVKVLPGRTFRLNDAVSEPYNADYDGDEMNLHVPQTEEARIEAEVLMRVENQILSVRHGKPIISGSMDNVSGAYLMTAKGSWFTKEQACKLLARAGIHELPKPNKDGLYYGKELFSMLLPKDFSIQFKNKLCKCKEACQKERCPTEGYTIIEDGKLVAGVIESTGLTNRILKELYMRYSPTITRDFIDRAIKITTTNIMLKGFTTSVMDTYLPDAPKKEVQKSLGAAEKRVEALVDKYLEGKLERVPGKNARETLEDLIMAELEKAREECTQITRSFYGEENNAVRMASIGARGSMIQVAQMASCLGQSAIRGQRMLRGYRTKSLPHFKEGDIGAPARGFVKSSFYDGLSPTEFFFHAMSGRDTLVDKGVRPARSGYMYRRLGNALVDIVLHNDSTVRDSAGTVVQFQYGEDGVDPTWCYGDKPLELNKYFHEKTGTTLDPKELEKILGEYQSKLPPSVLKAVHEQVKNCKPESARQILGQITNDYEKLKAVAGEPVGIVAAQSIGEPATQMTLRTFHFAGVAELAIPTGLPRFIELVDVRRVPKMPIMWVYLKPEFAATEEDIVRHAKELEEVRADIIARVDESQAPKKVSVSFDHKRMQEEGLKFEDIVKSIEKNTRKAAKLDGHTLILDVKSDNLRNYRRFVNRILDTKIKGVPGVRKAAVIQKGGSTIIQTEGINLADTLKLPWVDAERTTCNSVREIEEVLGIEAARNALLTDMKQVLDDNDLYVNVRHLMLIADLMCVDGMVRAVGRQGISGLKSSVFARAAFEETVRHLLDAALKGQRDELKGVTENIIVGQPISIGTGIVQLIMNKK